MKLNIMTLYAIICQKGASGQSNTCQATHKELYPSQKWDKMAESWLTY